MYETSCKLDRINNTGGIVLVSKQDDKLTGCIVGEIVQDYWMPDIRHLREVAWWVEPGHRGGSAGLRLLKHFQNHGEKLLDQGVITDIIITTLMDSPVSSLTKRGFVPVETNWALNLGGK